MRRSLRWRVQAWYAAVLLAVVGGFAGFLYQRVRESKFQEIDARLVGAADYLDASLRGMPGHVFDIRPRTDLTPPLAPPPLGRKPADQVLAELDVPRPESGRLYFAVWRGDGVLLHTSAVLPDVPLPDPLGLPTQRTPAWRGPYREVAMLGPQMSRILVGTGIEKERGDLRTFAWQLAGAGGLALGLGMLGGWWLSSRIVRPLRAIP